MALRWNHGSAGLDGAGGQRVVSLTRIYLPDHLSQAAHQSRVSELVMHEHVTLLPPDTASSQARGTSSTLPLDLLEQVRGRVRLLALLMMFGFALDPILFFGGWAVTRLSGGSLPAEFFRDALFYWGDIIVVAASGGLWWIASTRRVSASRLYTLGLLYEVAVCFVLSIRTFWEYYRDVGMLPNLTWVPAIIILFPLILPAPPRLMLAAAIA